MSDLPGRITAGQDIAQQQLLETVKLFFVGVDPFRQLQAK